MSSKGYIFEDENGNAVIPGSDAIITVGTGYSPSVTNTSNLDATPTISGIKYFRMGTRVHVSGLVLIDPTAASSASFEVSLPIASNLGNSYECVGGFWNGTVGAAGQFGFIVGEPTNNTARFEFVPGATSQQSYAFMFDYDII